LAPLELMSIWVCQPKARQMRATAMCDTCVACAIERVLQWVACGGVDSRVRVITSTSTCGFLIRRRPMESRGPTHRGAIEGFWYSFATVWARNCVSERDRNLDVV